MAKHLDGLMLRTFLEAVRFGSIGRAAASLGRTQPATTQILRRLEDVVGKRLLDRSARGVSPTKDGQKFLPFAKQIIDLSDKILGDFDHKNLGRRRNLVVKVGEDVAGAALLKAIVGAADDHAPVTLHVDSPANASTVEQLASGEIDMFIGEPLKSSSVSSLLSRSVNVPLVWACAPHFRAAVRPLPLALYPMDCAWRHQIVETLTSNQIDWFSVVESESLSAMLASARSGLSVIACLPQVLDAALVRLDPLEVGLPCPPVVEVALYRSIVKVGGAAAARIESALWKSVLAA